MCEQYAQNRRDLHEGFFRTAGNQGSDYYGRGVGYVNRLRRSRSAILRAARAKAIATQDWPTLLWLERDGVRLAALIANDLEPLALAAAAA